MVNTVMKNINSNQGPPPNNSSPAPLRRIRSVPQSSEVCSYGQISAIGRRRELKDVVVVDLGILKRGEESYDKFAVFDGGPDRIDSEEEVQATAVLTMVGKNELVVGGFGASKAVLLRGGAVLQLFDDYKLVKGDISEGRSLEPRGRGMRRSAADEFLILGSNGLWDVVSDKWHVKLQGTTATATKEVAWQLQPSWHS